jgi:hypothetical protein
MSKYYVDKILHGAKAADLPVQQPTKFELVTTSKPLKRLMLAYRPRYFPAPTTWSNNGCLLRCICPLVAQSGHAGRPHRCSLSG